MKGKMEGKEISRTKSERKNGGKEEEGKMKTWFQTSNIPVTVRTDGREKKRMKGSVEDMKMIWWKEEIERSKK